MALPANCLRSSMYTDDDLDAAVRRGAITAEGADALRHMAAERQPDGPLPPGAAPSEGESLRLVSGFQDVSVAGAASLTLASMVIALAAPVGAVAALWGAGAAAWGLAEHFTRRRRFALTSIVLMLAFVAAVCGAALVFTGTAANGAAWIARRGARGPEALAGWGVVVCAAAAIAAGLHWMRFRVPASMGVLAAAVAGFALAALLLAVPAAAATTKPLAFAAGVAVFAFAMRWDLSDPARRTLRSDVAFWLHLAAAPMVVGPAFAAIGTHGGSVSSNTAAAAIGLYVVLSAVALAVDRRALMASALFYLLGAVGSLLAGKARVDITALPLTGLVVGPALLLLSAFWGTARRGLLAVLPRWLERRLPPPPASRASDPSAAE